MPTQAELEQDLEDLYTARRLLVAAMADGKSVVEFEIRGRRFKYTDPARQLQVIRDEILFIQGKVSSRSPARNQVSIKRRRC